MVVGCVGFFYGAGFATGNPGIEYQELAGIFLTNGWLNLLHVVIGLVGLAAAPNGLAARAYCLGAGALFTVLGAWGLVEVGNAWGDLFGVIPVDPEGHVLHLAVGLAGIGAGLSSPASDGADDSLDRALV